MQTSFKRCAKRPAVRLMALLLGSVYGTPAFAQSIPTTVEIVTGYTNPSGVSPQPITTTYQVDIPAGATSVTINGFTYAIDSNKYTDPAYLPGGIFYSPTLRGSNINFLTSPPSNLIGTGQTIDLYHITGGCIATSASTTRCGNGPFGLSIATVATSDKIVLNAPTQSASTTTTTSYATTLNAKLIGGTLLYSNTFTAAFADPIVQAGIAQARLALTTAGGPGVVISSPVLLNHTATTSSVVTSTSYSLNHASDPTFATTQYVGPVTGLLVGDINNCGNLAAALPGTTAPACKVNTNTYTLDFAVVDTNTVVSTTYFIDQVQTVSTLNTIAETYLIQGVVKPIGVIHSVTSVASFEASEGFAGRGFAQTRSLDAPHSRWHPWFEYWGHANSTRGIGTAPGDTRSGSGVDGGVIYALSSNLVIGAGVDYGSTNLGLSDGSETGRMKLTQGAVFARIGAPTGFSALIGGGYGGGSVDTTVTIPGITQAATATEQVHNRWIGAEISDRVPVAGGRMILTPLAGISASSVKLGGFTETGSTYAIAGPRNTQTRTREWAGIDVEIPVTSRLSLTGGLKAVHYDGDIAPNRAVSFTAFPTITGLTVSAPATNRYGGSANAGATYRIAPHLSLFASGDMLAQDGNTDTGFRVGVSSVF